MPRTTDSRPRLERLSTAVIVAALCAGAAGVLTWWQGGSLGLGLGVYAASLSLVTLVLFYRDKRVAKRGRGPKAGRRVSEGVLLLCAILGGAAGGWLGMTWFRHKTRHARFAILLPLLAIAHVVGILVVAL